MIYSGTYTDDAGHRFIRNTFGQPNRATGPIASFRRTVHAPSATQTEYRAAMRELAHAWRNMTAEERQAWVAYDGSHPQTNRAGFLVHPGGYRQFLMHRLSAIRTGAPWQTPDPTLPVGSAIDTPYVAAVNGTSLAEFSMIVSAPWVGDDYCNIAVYQVQPGNDWDWTDPTATRLAYAEDPWPDVATSPLHRWITLPWPCLEPEIKLYLRMNDNDYNRAGWITGIPDTLHVSGNPNPNCTGTYTLQDNAPPAGYGKRYKHDSATWYLYPRWEGDHSRWIINITPWEPYDLWSWFRNLDYGRLGNYTGSFLYTGTPNVHIP